MYSNIQQPNQAKSVEIELEVWDSGKKGLLHCTIHRPLQCPLAWVVGLDTDAVSYSVPIFDEDKQVWYLVDPVNTRDKREIMLWFGSNNNPTLQSTLQSRNHQHSVIFTLTRESICQSLRNYRDSLARTNALKEKREAIEKIDEMIVYFQHRFDFDVLPTLRQFGKQNYMK